MVLTAFVGGLGPGQVRADSGSVLLAELEDSSGFGACCPPGSADATSVAISLIYGFSSFVGDKPPGISADVQIGGEVSHLPGSSGAFDFDASNSDDFPAFVAHSTNGIEEILWTCGFTLTSTGASLGGVCGGSPESFRLGGFPDLVGFSIDFVRLIVNRVEITITETPHGTGHDETHDAVWQIFGRAGRQVKIDIKPGSDPNSINPKSKGTIPVAILSAPDFDAPTRLDKSSLTFGRTGNEMSLAFCNKSPEDVNGDGLLDQVCHFNTNKAGFQPGDTEGILKGKTTDGIEIIGKDSVRIVKG